MRKKSIYFTVEAAMIAAAYVVLTLMSNIFNLAYGGDNIQFRISEALTILPIFTFSAIPGLCIGCFISNIISTLGPIDMIFGTTATLIAALLTFLLKNLTIKGLPILAFLPPVIINAVIIGIEINMFFLPEGASLWGFITSALSVGIGELGVCFVLGIPLYLTIKKYGFFSKN